jgi:RHS repeat-associated protein
MSDEGADLVADFGSFTDASDSMDAANQQLAGVAGDSASTQGAAGQAMEGSPLTAEAGLQLDKVHEILDGALGTAKQVTGDDVGSLTTAGQTIKSAEDGIVASAGEIKPDVTLPEDGGNGVPAPGRITAALSGSGDDAPGLTGEEPAVTGPAPDAGSGGTEPDLVDAAGNPSAAQGRGDIPTVGDPVDVATGDVVFAQADVTLPGALPLVVERVHRSSHRTGRWLGRSWTSTFDQRLEVHADRVIGAFADGRVLTWLWPPASNGSTSMDRAGALPVTGPSWLLRRAGEGAWTVTDRQRGLSWRFERPISYWLSGTGSWQGELPLVSVSDRTGHVVAFHYGASGEPTAVTHSAGYRVAVTTEGGRVTGLALASDGSGAIPLMRYEYDSGSGELAGVVNSSGQPLRFSYDPAGRMTGWTDRAGHSYRYVYDERGRCVRGQSPSGAQSGTFSYESGITRWTDGAGAVTAYELDGYARVAKIAGPAGGVTRFEHDERGRVTMQADSLGRVTRYAYDSAGNLVAVTRPDGRAARAEYDDRSLPVAVTGPDGAAWRQVYDERGNPTALTAPDGTSARYGYDEAGHLEAVTGPDGAVTRVACDAAGLLAAVTGPDGRATQYERDRLGRIVRVSAPGGAVTELTWTAEGHPASRRLPDGSAESWTWDADGHLARHVSPLGAVTAYQYGPFDKMTAVVWPDGTRTEFGYDRELQLTRLSHGGLTWRYEHDVAGRPTAQTDYNGAVTRYWYDAAGQLTREVNAAGQETAYGYDALGNLAVRTADGSQTTFGYDTAGRLIAARNADAEVVISRNQLGQVTAETVNGRAVTSAYDLAGRIARRVTPSGAVTGWSYDAAGRPAAMAAAGQELRFGYDPGGRESSRELPGGLTLTQDWDPRGRLAAQALTAPGAASGTEGPVMPGQVLQRRSYAYSPDGYLTGMDDLLTGSRAFGLDTVGRVTAVTGREWAEQYSYDPLGTITAAIWPAMPPEQASGWLDAGPQGPREVAGTLTSRAGNVRYRHDAAGRVIARSRTRISRKPETWHYSWDAGNRLTAVTAPDGTSWAYRYDPFGRRIAKQHLAADSSVIRQTRFAWDGTLLVEQSETGGPDEPEQVTTWDYQPGTFTPLAQSSRTLMRDATQDEIDQRFYAIITDLTGTPSELIAEDGTLAGYQQHTLWGGTIWHPGGASVPLRFPGQYADPETGLHYNNSRYYDPVTGGYLTPDPLGLVPAPNPHAYVPNPLVLIDPLGLEPGAAPLALGPARTATELRNMPGAATGGYSLPQEGAGWLKGSESNFGRIPGQIADQLRGQTFDNFNEFRQAFWKAVGKDPSLSSAFSSSNVSRMLDGYAPRALPTQQLLGSAPSSLSYALHHMFPIHAGGGVYDMDNLWVVTPLLHSSVLDPTYHYEG